MTFTEKKGWSKKCTSTWAGSPDNSNKTSQFFGFVGLLRPPPSSRLVYNPHDLVRYIMYLHLYLQQSPIVKLELYVHQLRYHQRSNVGMPRCHKPSPKSRCLWVTIPSHGWFMALLLLTFYIYIYSIIIDNYHHYYPIDMRIITTNEIGIPLKYQNIYI